MRSIQANISEFERSLTFFSSKFDETAEQLKSITEKMKTISSDNEVLKKENHFLKVEIWNLKRSVNTLEQDKLQSSVEISGVPETKNENLTTLMIDFGSKLNVPISEVDITSVFRIPSMNRQAPRKIAANFANRSTKTAMLNAIKKQRNFAAKDIHPTFSKDESIIFINDRLTPENRRLFWLSRRLAAEYNIKFCGTSGGRILLRRVENGPTIRINDESDTWKRDSSKLLANAGICSRDM